MEKAFADGLKVIVIGGSGATGVKLVEHLVANDRVEHIVNVGRRVYQTLPSSPKLMQVVADFEKLDEILQDDHVGPHYDLAFIVLGTTRAQAGSDKAFFHIDHDYALNFAQVCKTLGVRTMNLLTSQGADKGSWFLYMRTKGHLEEDVRALGFPRLNIHRPGRLERHGDRFWEKVAAKVLPALPVEALAHVMVHQGLRTHTDGDSSVVDEVDNKRIWKLAKELHEEL